MRKKIRNKVVLHHVLYEYDGCSHKQKEVVVPILYIEHHFLTQLQRRGKYVSKGFLDSLKHFIWVRETTGEYIILDTNLSEYTADTIIKEKDGKDGKDAGEENKEDKENKEIKRKPILVGTP